MQSTPHQLPATISSTAQPGLTVLAGRAAPATGDDANTSDDGSVALRLLISSQHSNFSSVHVAIRGLPPLTYLRYSVECNHSVLVGGNGRVSATGELALPQFEIVSPAVAFLRVEGEATVGAAATDVAATVRPVVGAIRWDAWSLLQSISLLLLGVESLNENTCWTLSRYGDIDAVGAYVEKALTPQQWRYRLPFFGKEVSDSQVTIHGNTTAVMEQELAYAEQYGIDYWAFVAYPPPSNMFYANALYLQVTNRTRSTKVKFCLIMDGNQLSVLEKDLDRIVGYFMLPTYQTVLGGRPLVYSKLCMASLNCFVPTACFHS